MRNNVKACEPTSCAGIKAKRVHLAIEQNQFGQLIALCEGIRDHNLATVSGPVTCSKCCYLAAELFIEL